MPTPVKIYRWVAATDSLPLSEDNWTMYALPSPGDRYWHGDEGFTVRDVDAAQDPPVVNLVYDRAWIEEVNGRLPDGYVIDGGRSADDGQWHFGAVTPQDTRFVPTWGDDLEETLERAIAAAAEHNRA